MYMACVPSLCVRCPVADQARHGPMRLGVARVSPTSRVATRPPSTLNPLNTAVGPCIRAPAVGTAVPLEATRPIQSREASGGGHRQLA